MARRALIVGVNHYDKLSPESQLTGSISDAQKIADLLSAHHDGAPNYDCIILLSDPTEPITRAVLRQALEKFFVPTDDELLFYFSGHGSVEASGGYIVTQDGEEYDLGIPMDELLSFANQGGNREAVLILDCCMSGHLGNPGTFQGNGDYQRSVLSPNVTILAASRHNEAAIEVGGQGLFTTLLIDALDGTAGDVLGNVTIPSIYAHIEGALGPWEQRPIYKTYITAVTIVRKAIPHINPADLRQLPVWFPEPDALYQLSPEYEYDKVADTEKEKLGMLFKHFRDSGLICTEVSGDDFYWAAKESRSLKLTPLGRHFWRLVRDRRI